MTRRGPSAQRLPRLRARSSALVLSVTIVLAAACGATTPSSQPTATTLHVTPEPSARTGQLPVPAGRAATQGPIGLNPSKANGKAYLTLIHKVRGAFTGDSDQRVVTDGTLVCAHLNRHEDANQVMQSLAGRSLTPFESYVVAVFAAEYFCPQDAQQALKDTQEALTQSSSRASHPGAALMCRQEAELVPRSPEPREPRASQRPIDPSISSRRMSAWPACLAVSSRRWASTHRSVTGDSAPVSLQNSSRLGVRLTIASILSHPWR